MNQSLNIEQNRRPDSARKQGKILVVDDEMINREMLASILRKDGYSVEVASGGHEALNKLERDEFDLVLLDVVMPEMDGFECLQQIRQTYQVSELPVIMVTAEAERERIIEAFRAGANDYLTKPIDREITLARIATQTLLRTSLRALKESEERYALAALGSNDGLWDWDVARTEVYYSPRWKAMLGFREEELTNSPDEWINRIHPEDSAKFRETFFAHSIGNHANLKCEIRMCHRDGAYRWMICRGVSVCDKAGEVYRIAGSLTDVTEGKVGDALTGLPNRFSFRDRLERAIEKYKRNNTKSFAVLFLDLDHFKLINDSLGHQAGDYLLITVAKRLEQCVRQTDAISRVEVASTIARHAGDEFTILLEGLENESSVETVVNRILEGVRKPVEIGSSEITPSFSIGWTTSKNDNLSAENLLREADTAMYQAKSGGRNRACRYSQSMQYQATQRLELEHQMRNSLANKDFFLVYQPIIGLPEKKIIGFESLVRWRHSVKGVVFPDQFITIAEETGLIIPLGWQIAEMACDQAAAWDAEFPDRELVITINFSMKQFVQHGFMERFREIIERSGAQPSRLCIEVTESILVEKTDQVREILQAIRDMGAKIAVDDFGTGFSSLSHLHRLPLDILKIDRSFIAAMLQSRENEQIIRTILNLASNLGLRVVAEGVETPEQRDHLIEIGCKFAQGYLWSRPVELAQATALLFDRCAAPFPELPVVLPTPIHQV